MLWGKGIKESAAEKLAAKVAPDLLAGEEIVLVCKCNNLKPLVDRILLTNQRLLAASAADGKVKYRAGLGRSSTLWRTRAGREGRSQSPGRTGPRRCSSPWTPPMPRIL